MRVYDVKEVALFFLSQTDPDDDHSIDHLKLQKLCYYAQGIACAVRGLQLFDSSITAWEHGPVIKEIYDSYHKYGSQKIPKPRESNADYFEPNDLEILLEVYKSFGQYSGWKLREMTHKEAPWLEAIDRTNKTISINSLKEFFTEVIENPEKELIDSIHILNFKTKNQLNFEGYEVVNPEEITDFLKRYDYLGEIVREANKEIKKTFTNSALYLELVIDREYPKDIKLVISISPEFKPKEAFQKLKELKQSWWHQVSKNSRNKLALTLGYR